MTSISPRSSSQVKTGTPPILSSPGRFARSWQDLVEGLDQAWLWSALAWQDIRLRYRGSMLGPFWFTLTTAIMIGAMGLLYARLFRVDTSSYLPFLSTGLIVWQFISTLITEGCGTFVQARQVIQQAKMPYSIHAYRIVCRNLIVFAHSVIILPVAFLAVDYPFSWRALLALPALVVLAVNGVWISLVLGMLSARFGDVPPIVASVLQVVFFVTPVFWMPEALGKWQGIAQCNPLFAAIDIVRAPILGATTAPYSWAIVAGISIVGTLSTLLLFARLRARIAYWV